jgi:hypothetical protein
MDKFTLQFDMENDAFGVATWEACDEAARILREIADKLEHRNWSGKIRDVNGNAVGEYEADFSR